MWTVCRLHIARNQQLEIVIRRGQIRARWRHNRMVCKTPGIPQDGLPLRRLPSTPRCEASAHHRARYELDSCVSRAQFARWTQGRVLRDELLVEFQDFVAPRPPPGRQIPCKDFQSPIVFGQQWLQQLFEAWLSRMNIWHCNDYAPLHVWV